NDEKITPKTDDIEIWLAVPGTARYIIPESMLGHEGKVTSYVYLEFSDGSHTDEGHFTFEIKQSMITDMLPEAGEQYVKDFEDIKAEVQEAADGAKETISQKVTEVSDTSDSAISKVNQTADDTIKAASEAKSDVQSKEGEASESIDEAVKSTESARDEAAKTMNEIDYSNRNLLLDSGVPVKNRSYVIESYRMSENMENVTYTLTIKGNLGEGKTKFVPFIGNGNGDNNLGSMKDLGDGYHKLTFIGKVPSDKPSSKLIIYVYPSSPKTESSIEWAKLNHGTLSTPWTPAPEEIVIKSEIEQIKQAIIALGGEI
ncbi:phage baseplate upper protein, partial [Tetragenococcus koreensis]|uniref:BppU family phage baseplate upper protein n=1 Tax=Tetragenococcus koreensis TaxID=290335 RepID=UPI001F36E6AD